MIIITGALGFIGSCLVQELNNAGHVKDLFVVDDFYKDYKEANLDRKFIREWIHRDIFLPLFEQMAPRVSFVFHLGARTDTAETDRALFDRLNVNYSKSIWDICTRHQIPLIYASSAATYGGGKKGYSDAHEIVSKLKPLNAYGDSKNEFDKWVLKQKKAPPFWAGLKFFNVYGPNESHKKRMASVVYHCFRQIRKDGSMKLFRSHKKGIAHGHQQRDFIYVKDVVKICHWLYQKQPESGLYNIGTGEARTFLDLVNATFAAMGEIPEIDFIDTPKDIRKTYQYFTEAEMGKLQKAGYKAPLYTLEEGVADYVKEHLLKGVKY